jgi:predicted nucleic acid-binding protein
VIVLDTNIVSALMAGGDEIDPWLATVPRHEIYTTVMTRAEIRYGLARLPVGRRRSDLIARADALFQETWDRLLTFEARAADRYGELVASRQAIGRPLSVPDGIIASITWVHHAILATRNIRDFEECGIEVVNPYESYRDMR